MMLCGANVVKRSRHTRQRLSKLQSVIPAKAGTERLQGFAESLDPGLTSFAVVERFAGMTAPD